ncbi:MAG: DpnII family type II restriction endonuclease, partial [Promethearchaeota archaeon]
MLYKELGFSSFDECLDYFLNTLLISNKTYQYFVDWNKVKEIIRNYLDEISLLNSIVKVSSNEREKRFFQLLSKYPRIAEIIPMIIAERVKSGVIDIFDPEIENFIHYEFQ